MQQYGDMVSTRSSKRPTLPEGYRLVAIASDNWVLVAPGGRWVANYRGDLDLWRAIIDARNHDPR